MPPVFVSGQITSTFSGATPARVLPILQPAAPAPIVDTRSFFSDSDLFLMGLGAALVLFLVFSVAGRKTQHRVRRYKRSRRRKAIAYHRGELSRLKRKRRVARSGAGGGRGVGPDTPVKIGKGAAVKFRDLPPDLQRQIGGAA